jgi:hypothetical protein
MCSKTRGLSQKRDTALHAARHAVLHATLHAMLHAALHAVLHAALHAFLMSLSLSNRFFDRVLKNARCAACAFVLCDVALHGLLQCLLHSV